MTTRIIWGVLALIATLLIVIEGKFVYTLVVGVFSVLAVLEYVALLKKQDLRPQTEVMVGYTVVLVLLIAWKYLFKDLFPAVKIGNIQMELLFALLLVLCFLTTLALELFRGDPDQGLINASVNLFGTVYIGFMFAYILLLRFIQDGFFYLLFAFIVTIANDSAAYFVGIKFGKHKLSPRISPKKSIEGSIGGIGGGIIGAVIMGLCFRKSLIPLVILGILVVIAGQFGDLVESIIKRNAGVKDSGNFLPGHGGILDRVDSLLFAAPVVYYFVIYIVPMFKSI